MLTKRQAEEIVRDLSRLPSDKVTEVQDYILFLKERYSRKPAVDRSEVWTEEDLHDLVVAVLNHADGTLE